MAVCYLLHFSKPFGTAQSDTKRAKFGLSPRKREFIHGARHYLGFANNLEGRVWHHRNGTGATLTQHAVRAGCELIVARTWENATRETERKLKRAKHHSRLCPVCNPDHAMTRGKVETQEETNG